MSRVLKNELQILRENLMACFRETLPTKQVNAVLSLSLIWMHVLADKEEGIQNPKERRRLMEEFDRNKEPLDKAIQKIRESKDGNKTLSPKEACPECGEKTYPEGGCQLCMRCGWSPCG